jgi:predicted dehydrogenase
MNVAIIGCGLIGRKRALALDPDDRLAACCDIQPETAERFAKEFNCPCYSDYNQLLGNADCDAVVVAVVNKYIQQIVVESLKMGKHVLAEKPLGRNASEAREMVVAQQDSKVWSSQVGVPSLDKRSPVLKTGFNHRFHPAVFRAKGICNDGGIGTILNIRARYGHGGRPGMEKEWRSSKDLCGGGELLDQGVHVIDLINWFGGDVREVFGKVETRFWDIEVEDNAFAILKTDQDITASFHVSWTNWKNIFSFEIFGTEGYLRIEGLGGSYGPETLEHGRRKKEGGRPDIETVEFPPEDVSWKAEWKEFKAAIRDNREPIGSGLDGLKASWVVDAIYRSSKEKKAMILPDTKAVGET